MAKEVQAELHFKVGQLAESMSFEKGFRGAWFRCEIKKILKSVELSYVLDFYDFPDDKPVITKVYQRRSKKMNEQLMIRPCYPTVYKESELPDASEITEVAVVVDDTWRVGDLIDWSDSGCYWSGKIMKLLDNGKAQVDLLPQPQGEGESYTCCLLEDLRPSLDWSLEHGWTVPNQNGTAGRPCARLIGPPSAQVMQTKNGVQETEISAVSVPSPLLSRSKDEVKTKGTKENHTKGSSANLLSKEMDSPETVKNPYSGVIPETKRSTKSSVKLTVPSPLSSKSINEVKITGTSKRSRKRSIENTDSKEEDKLESIQSPDCGPGTDSDPCAGRVCARLFGTPFAQVTQTKNGVQETETSAVSPANPSTPSPLPSNSIEEVKSTATNGRSRKHSLENTVSNEEDKLEIPDSGPEPDSDTAPVEPMFGVDLEDYFCDCIIKKFGLSENYSLRSLRSNTVEAAVMDLEESLNKVKWLKTILLNGMSSEEQQKPQWKYVVDKRAASSQPK